MLTFLEGNLWFDSSWSWAPCCCWPVTPRPARPPWRATSSPRRAPLTPTRRRAAPTPRKIVRGKVSAFPAPKAPPAPRVFAFLPTPAARRQTERSASPTRPAPGPG